jgi:hypothetical protein
MRLAGGTAIVSEHKVLRKICEQLSREPSQLIRETIVASSGELQLCDQKLAHGGA